MITSMQRIAGALLGTALLAFTLVTTYQVTALCTAGNSGCLAAAVTFGVPQSDAPEVYLATSYTQTTAETTADNPVQPLGVVLSAVQLVSIYVLLLSVLLIIVLELFELRYLKRLVELRSNG